ncbi:MAG: SdiA-regulated domain-containing protein [Saprospiraceae bacterium]|nr:SdiA-regulated domain-containing protein [Saprospiraceae bacterium]
MPEPSAIGYDLGTPDQTLVMSKKLTEISGLGLSSDEKSFVAVQDEDGIVFFINTTTGKIEREVEFQDKGDYEGVEMVGQDIFVVKSTGTIYKISPSDGKYDKVEKFNFFLNEENDVEGLAYDAANHRLLLACKAQAGQGKDFKMKKGIYGFDLKTMTLGEAPVFTVSLEDVLSYLSAATYVADKDQLLAYFEKDADEFAFAPSSIAIHPLTGQIYILSSVGKLLIVIDKDNNILHVEKLKKKLHTQPEGICFDKAGTMYISNEGKDDEPGKILIFKMKS